MPCWHNTLILYFYTHVWWMLWCGVVLPWNEVRGQIIICYYFTELVLYMTKKFYKIYPRCPWKNVMFGPFLLKVTRYFFPLVNLWQGNMFKWKYRITRPDLNMFWNCQREQGVILRKWKQRKFSINLSFLRLVNLTKSIWPKIV